MANNLGLKTAFKKGADLGLILNSDIIADAKMVENLVKTYNRKKMTVKKLGLIQPVILLAQNRNKVNTLGNTIHYLGFGYCGNYFTVYKKSLNDKEIFSVSGAAMLISRQYFNQVGGFDENFFMLGEDQDLSWRGLILGYKHFISSKAIAYHDYQFGRHQQHKYLEEKNRLIMLMKNYSGKTLVFLTPILLINEIAIIIYSILESWLGLKLKTYWAICRNLKIILKKRKEVQKKRVVNDKKLFSIFKPTIDFPPVNNFVIRYLVNPLYLTYYRLVYFFL